jgi:ribosomal protein L28
MFKCQLTGKQIGPGVSPVKAIVETRQRRYTNEVKKKIIESNGWEIVRELMVAPDVAAKMAKEKRNG